MTNMWSRVKSALSRDPDVEDSRPGVSLELTADDTASVFEAPPWLRRAGLTSGYAILVVVALIGFLWLLASLKFIVVPLILSVVLAVLFEPMVDFMARHKVSRGAGSAIIVFALIAVACALTYFLAASIAQSIPALQDAVTSVARNVNTWLTDLGLTGKQSSDTTTALIKGGGEAAGILISGVVSGVGAIVGLLAGGFLAMFILLFLLTDLPRFGNALIESLPLPRQAAATVVDDFTGAIRGYYKAVTVVGAINGLVIGVVALIMDVPLVGAIVVVTFVTSYIPFFGAFIAGGFAAFIAFGSGGWVPALVMIVVSILYNNVASNIIQPLASGRTLNLHPLVVLIVTTAGGVLFGIIGAMLAAPIAGGFVTVRRDFAEARKRSEATPDGVDASASSDGARPPGTPASTTT